MRTLPHLRSKSIIGLCWFKTIRTYAPLNDIVVLIIPLARPIYIFLSESHDTLSQFKVSCSPFTAKGECGIASVLSLLHFSPIPLSSNISTFVHILWCHTFQANRRHQEAPVYLRKAKYRNQNRFQWCFRVICHPSRRCRIRTRHSRPCRSSYHCAPDYWQGAPSLPSPS